MWAGAPITADVTLSEANMANKNLQVQATSGSAERFNRVRGKFVDPSRNFTANAYPEQRNAAFESADNGPKYEVFDINTCNDSFEAQRDAQIKLCQSRNQRIVVFPGNWSCFRIQPGSVVELDIAELGFSGEKFFVTQWELATDGSGVQLTMVEENDACWTQTFQYVVRSPTGELQFNLFGNCKLSGDNIHRFAVGTSASAGYKMRSDGILEYQLADGTYTTVGVPIDEWMLTPLPFWTKTEQNFGDPLDVGTPVARKQTSRPKYIWTKRERRSNARQLTIWKRACKRRFSFATPARFGIRARAPAMRRCRNRHRKLSATICSPSLAALVSSSRKAWAFDGSNIFIFHFRAAICDFINASVV
jgi:hypothetical protein